MQVLDPASESTPHDVVGEGPVRDRAVDFLRVLAIGLVVLGHWLVTSPTYHDGAFQAPSVLGTIRWGQWVTLAFQVMPVFFLVGGYAAAISWAGHARRGGSAVDWLRARTMRLLLPTAAYVLLALVAVAVCIALGALAGTLALAGWAIALQLWFLPVYLALTALTPVLHAAHQRWGLAVPAAMAVAGIALDFIVIYAGPKPLGWLNYVLVWGAVYQVGFAWQDGTLTCNRRLLPTLAAVGALTFAGLVVFGPFPPSLIGVPGDRVDNTAPPSAALVAYIAVQIPVVVAAAPAIRHWLRSPGRWRAVSQANAAVMGVYLWHMVPAAVGALVFYPTGILPQPTIGSAEWWELRPVWIIAIGLLLALLLWALAQATRLIGRRSGARGSRPPAVERHTSRPSSGRATLLWIGIALSGYALYRFAVFGFAPDGKLPWTAAICFAAGTASALLSAERRRTSR